MWLGAAFAVFAGAWRPVNMVVRLQLLTPGETAKLPGRVVRFRLALSWLVQVLKSVAGAAFSEKWSAFCGFSDTRNYLVQYFLRTTFTGCRPSLWQTHLRTSSPDCSAMPTKRRVLRSRGSFLSLPFSFASDCTEAGFASIRAIPAKGGIEDQTSYGESR